MDEAEARSVTALLDRQRRDLPPIPLRLVTAGSKGFNFVPTIKFLAKYDHVLFGGNKGVRETYSVILVTAGDEQTELETNGLEDALAWTQILRYAIDQIKLQQHQDEDELCITSFVVNDRCITVTSATTGKKVYIQGVSHFHGLGVELVHAAFKVSEPDAVVVELDERRLDALERQRRSSLRAKIWACLKSIPYSAQFAELSTNVLAHMFGLANVGEEFLFAIEEAVKSGSEIAFGDVISWEAQADRFSSLITAKHTSSCELNLCELVQRRVHGLVPLSEEYPSNLENEKLISSKQVFHDVDHVLFGIQQNKIGNVEAAAWMETLVLQDMSMYERQIFRARNSEIALTALMASDNKERVLVVLGYAHVLGVVNEISRYNACILSSPNGVVSWLQFAILIRKSAKMRCVGIAKKAFAFANDSFVAGDFLVARFILTCNSLLDDIEVICEFSGKDVVRNVSDLLIVVKNTLPELAKTLLTRRPRLMPLFEICEN